MLYSCDGVLKIRGKKKDLVAFMKDEIIAIEKIDFKEKEITVQVIEDVFDCSCQLDRKKPQYFRFKGSEKIYIHERRINFWYDEESEENTVCYMKLTLGKINKFNIGKFRRMSKLYHLDFNLFATDSRMEFEQYITIIDGKIFKNETIKFYDYKFEANIPNMKEIMYGFN